jgi:glycosyltransferase involved in cell wall biosynthesis
MSGEGPLFSVIIPTFNRVLLLSNTLDSVFAQQHTDYEIIVVDDGSTDQTIDYLNSLGKDVRVFQQSNRGAGAARNLGARHAQGQYLAFLDSDDIWFRWTLQVYQEVIREQRDPSFVAGKPFLFSDKLSLEKVKFGPTQTERFVDFLASGDEMRWWGASSFVIRRDAFMAVGGFTEEWVNDEDTDFTLKIGVAPCFVQIAVPVTFAYREHAASVSKDLTRKLAGTWARIRNEREGRYPGGRARARERRRIVTRHVRPVTLGCLQEGLWRVAWKLYIATFVWHASLGRVKYLTAFPLLASMSYLRALHQSHAIDAKSVVKRENPQVHDGH